jgi:hypothetical protein
MRSSQRKLYSLILVATHTVQSLLITVQAPNILILDSFSGQITSCGFVKDLLVVVGTSDATFTTPGTGFAVLDEGSQILEHTIADLALLLDFHMNDAEVRPEIGFGAETDFFAANWKRTTIIVVGVLEYAWVEVQMTGIPDTCDEEVGLIFDFGLNKLCRSLGRGPVTAGSCWERLLVIEELDCIVGGPGISSLSADSRVGGGIARGTSSLDSD